TTLLLCAIMVPGRVVNLEIEKRHVKAIEVRPVTPRNGKNVALSVAVNAPSNVKLPRGLTALVNDHQVHLYDDGRWPDDSARDGVYSAGGRTKEGQQLKDKTTLLNQSSGLLYHHAPAVDVKCTLTIVDCQKNCKSVLLG